MNREWSWSVSIQSAIQRLAVLGLIGLIGAGLPLAASRATDQTDSPARAGASIAPSELYGKLPLSFEANQGQTDDAVRFLARGPGYGLFLTPTEVVLALQARASPSGRAAQAPAPPADPGGTAWTPAANPGSALRMQLVGANPQPEVIGQTQLPGTVNYFVGNDPAEWRTNVPTYGQVQYMQVYPGVDLVLYGAQSSGQQVLLNPSPWPDLVRPGQHQVLCRYTYARRRNS